jgi:hypothetical protein
MTRIMTRTNVPIRFRFIKLPVTWELQDHKRLGTVLRGQLKIGREADKVPLSELDGWKLRDEFFRLPDNDPHKLLAFLNAVGAWSEDPEEAALDSRRYPCYAHLDDVWRFRTDLKDALLREHRQSFIRSVAPRLTKPKTLADLHWGEPYSWVNSFQFCFELSDVAAGVVSITNARRMLLATVFVDIARQLRFKICQRPDCGKMFPLESKRKKKFCDWYCGHITTVRRNRPHKGRRKNVQKST